MRTVDGTARELARGMAEAPSPIEAERLEAGDGQERPPPGGLTQSLPDRCLAVMADSLTGSAGGSVRS